MRLSLMLLLGLCACVSDNVLVGEGFMGGVGGDVSDDCAPTRPVEVLELSLEEPAQVLRFESPCGEVGFDAELDDPDGAFAIADVAGAGPGGDLEVEVALVATGPGVYEAQLSVGFPGGARTAVEIFAQIDGEQE